MMENVGTRDALMRISVGVLLVAWSASRQRWSWTSALSAAYGATKVAEGITRYCPLLAVFGLTTRDETDAAPIAKLAGIEWRQMPRPSGIRTLWGVRQDPEGEERLCTAPDAVDTKGWHWEPSRGAQGKPDKCGIGGLDQ